MSVYTPVGKGELEAFLRHYEVGRLRGYEGIAAGVENTNYFVTTDREDLVLTVFESLSGGELPYFLGAAAHLSGRGVPCPAPVADRHGRSFSTLKGRPAMLARRLPGASVERPAPSHCAAVGRELARLHRSGASFRAGRHNSRGLDWSREAERVLRPRLPADEGELLRTELDYQLGIRRDALPRGIIHGDLFRDNVLFAGGTLTGILDLYAACDEVWLYDVAVAVNDWCLGEQSVTRLARSAALLAAYHRQRSFQAAEFAAWPAMLRAAALRFWLSRLYDRHFPRQGEMTHQKDPDAFKALLIRHRQGSPGLARLIRAGAAQGPGQGLARPGPARQ